MKNIKRQAISLIFAFGLSGGLSGCNGPLNQLSGALNSLITSLRGGSSAAPAQPQAQASPAHTLTPSENAKRYEVNKEILGEVYRVVYDRKPSNDLSSRSEFGNYLDSMNQGASIEGLYNGFTHSSDYRKLEVENPGAKSEALSFFASELAQTEALLKPPTVFGPDAAQPLPLPVNPGAPSADDGANPGVSEVRFGSAGTPKPSPSAPSISELEANYLKTFKGASIYTLKRVLGDEMLRLVGQMSADPKALQAWYGAWVVRMCGMNVDFGIPLRNKADAAFHSQWAAHADADRLRWEVLNRIHRVLNARNGGPL